MQQLQSVVKHEFGHALGLGHYKADDPDVSIAWARGTITAPSIMAVFSHQNLNENIITPKDIVAVRSIYGQNGFLPDEDQVTVFDSFQSTSEEYIIPEGGFTTASVDGVINKDMYLSGLQVDITVIDPNQSIQSRKVRVNSDGVFNFQTILDESILNGTYTVFASYRDKQSQEITMDIKYEEKGEESKIPSWVQYSVKWWALDKISELDFILGIQHLIRTGVLNPPSSENQTPENIEDDIAFGVKIPKYVKQTSLWWTEGKISDEEFVDGIQYLIKKGILVI
jgi:hypothetical protein